MALRPRSVVARQSEAAALGGRDDMEGRVPQRLREAHGKAFRGGLVDGIRIRAYYPPTRDLWTITDYVKSLSWADAVDQAAVSASLELDNSDGEIGSRLNRPGIIVFVEFKAPDGEFKERLRLVVWDTSITDLRTGTLTWTCFDHLLYLQMAKGSFKYTKDKKHRKGWTASEIIEDICRRYRIPVATRNAKRRPARKKGRKKGTSSDNRGRYRIVKTSFRFDFNATNLPIYEAIAQVLTIDSKKTGKSYFIESDKGRLVVRRRRQLRSILALAEDHNVRSATFARSMSEVFQAFEAAGTDKGKKGKPRSARSTPKPKLGPKDRKRRAEARRKAATRSRRARLRGEPGEPSSNEEGVLTSALLFGAMKYTPYNKKLSINDPTWSRASARAAADKLSRAKKTLSISADGNVLIRQGDRIHVAVAFSTTKRGTPRLMRREVFVSSVTHTIVPGDYSMDIECGWREKEVAVKQEKDGSSETTDAESKTEGQFSKEELVQLAASVGFPDPNTAAAVAMAESQGNPRANGDLSLAPLGSRGLWQIYTKAHPQYDPEKLFEPQYNAQAAIEVFRGAGNSFSPWTMFTNGTYKKYL